MATFLVVHPYLDIYGGGERVCHNVIKTLISKGQDVELLTFDFDSERYKEIVGDEFPKEVHIHSLGKRIEVEPPFTIYKRHRNLVKLLKRYRDVLKYDYLFSTQSSSPFEPIFLNQARKNFAYVHFPEIHFDYAKGAFKRKLYLWLFKHWVEQGIGKLDLVFCNSEYTKEAIIRYWKSYGVKEPIVVYPPINLHLFWCETSLETRRKRVVYTARFIPIKRHEILKKLALDLPAYDFISVGGLIDAEKKWFENFSQNLPRNYVVKPNLPGPELLKILHDSRIYVHLMEAEHFGIAPVEGLASGCVTLVHDSGGMREFIPEAFRWNTYDDLKQKIVTNMNNPSWDVMRRELWRRIEALTPDNFENGIWQHLKIVMET